jgi:hypothetical protein
MADEEKQSFSSTGLRPCHLLEQSSADKVRSSIFTDLFLLKEA